MKVITQIKRKLNLNIPIKPDKRLSNTPYRAMQEHAGRKLKQPFIPKTYTYDPNCFDLRTKKDKQKLTMDINHEHIEHDNMNKGISYKIAHKLANRKQRSY
jgi:hypothetical protein